MQRPHHKTPEGVKFAGPANPSRSLLNAPATPANAIKSNLNASATPAKPLRNSRNVSNTTFATIRRPGNVSNTTFATIRRPGERVQYYFKRAAALAECVRDSRERDKVQR